MSRREYRPYVGRRKGCALLKAFLALVLAGVLCFSALLGAVLWGSFDHVAGDPQVMVILGCQVKPSGPSVLLRDRLDKALGYLEEHPGLTVIVSGGQGPDEPVAEARAMRDYLAERGVDPERILQEDRSHNTWQNLNYTLRLMEEHGLDPDGGVVVVSSGFHLTRVRMLWGRAAGDQSGLSTLAAPSTHVPSRLKMYIREPIALVKSFLLDR